jgi:hypothetical protein
MVNRRSASRRQIEVGGIERRGDIGQFMDRRAGPCHPAIAEIIGRQRCNAARWRQRRGGFLKPNLQPARRRRFEQRDEVGNIGREIVAGQPVSDLRLKIGIG